MDGDRPNGCFKSGDRWSAQVDIQLISFDIGFASFVASTLALSLIGESTGVLHLRTLSYDCAKS